MILRPLALALLVALPCARADEVRDRAGAESGPEDQDPLTILMDFELNERQVVESAAKTRTTIQEAPAIVTVITQREIRDRGYRTLNDVLQTIPGFEGDRWEYNGWLKDNLTRGLPHTALVLLDGVNIVEPARNLVVLDRKIPLDIVKRIEIISGPGGVLWGSNALLGVINIITHDGASKPGFELIVGGGHGPGEQAAARTHLSWGGAFLDNLLRVYISTTWFTTEGPSLTIDQQQVVGPLPSPSPDSYSIYAPGERTVEPAARDHYFNVTGNISLGPVTLGWFTGFESEHRELGSNGVVLTAAYYDDVDTRTDDVSGLVSEGSDQVHSAYLRYADRFFGQTFGVNLQAHMVYWEIDENPFGVFPRSDLLNLGVRTSLASEGVWRGGLHADFDVLLPANHRLLIGGELFADTQSDSILRSHLPFALEGDTCLPGFDYRPDLDPVRPCSADEVALEGAERYIGALYATDEWRVSRHFALSAGLRGQFSTDYNPTVLLSGGMVGELSPGVFLKATYSEGFRPPDFQSTSATGPITSGVTLSTNPDLDVERSRSAEVEINARLLENVGPIRQLYLRADYAYTHMSGVITQPQGRFANAGDRHIHTVELLGKLHFQGDHELWISYYFVDVLDPEIGRLRNIANHVVNAGGRVSLFDGHLHLATVFTLRGPMEDLNRTAALPTPGAPPSIEGTVSVAPTGLEVTEIPTAALWRIGVEGRNLFGRWDIGAWVYNVLDDRYQDPDLFFDDRVVPRPQPKPRISFFLESRVRW